VPDLAPAPAPIPPESSLGVADTGIWSDLDDQLNLTLPADLAPSRTAAVLSADATVLVLYIDAWPAKAYPVLAADPLTLRPGDAAELDGLLDHVERLAPGATPPPGDRDGDNLPDPLDVLVGAKKTAIQAGPYGGQYMSLAYPGGDLPRDMGVCTDVVIRSLRNAGLDLQVEVHRDIARSRRSDPMVKGKGDTNIDHRRVKTILPWFKRHAEAHTADLDDDADPYRPGDIVFLDTFESKPGPDHIGVVSDSRGESGHLLVINAWTDGYVTQEMDLLGWVPVTHRFRL
jgi:uncharacterized protein YijF (DUF1287 family)